MQPLELRQKTTHFLFNLRQQGTNSRLYEKLKIKKESPGMEKSLNHTCREEASKSLVESSRSKAKMERRIQLLIPAMKSEFGI